MALTTFVTTMSGSPSWGSRQFWVVSVRSSRYPAFRQSGKHRPHSEPIRSGAFPAQGHSTGAGRRQRQRPVGPLPCPYRVHRTVTDPGKRSLKPVSGVTAVGQASSAQRANPVRGSPCAGTFDRCWPSTTPASGWPASMSIPGSPNGYSGS